ncbi:pilus assembly protein CpaE [Abditibacterium utsteinense]|uniref:Pilus assembly protein CpaE n=1 Tax=Abditibacterium utsteinense TaxID=1960156 RepID=A0A2S8SU21_9BACT|nr:response regulator [Abditibacterium utsteinense]PQV64239.1 pilus assembly protein CpaE [Abditibacterium utsteinense]
MAISVLIADAKLASRQELQLQLERDRSIEVVSEASDGRQAVDQVRALRPSIVLLDSAIIGLDSIAVIEQIETLSPETAVIVLIDGADMELMRRLMRAGARDCLMRPLSQDDLISTIKTAFQSSSKLRDAAQAGPVFDTSKAQGDIIAVYSPQGGAGKSMLSANLAVAMAKAAGEGGKNPRIALVDLNLQFGDIDLMLNLSPQNTIAGLAQKGHGGIDAELLEQYLTVHPESGLRILVAPSTPQYAESITVYTVEQVVETLRENYDIIIVDTPSQLQDTTLAVLDAAKTILLLTSLDLLALHKTRTALEMLRQLYAPEKIQLILNRANSDVGISLADVENVLGVPMRAQIPSDGKVVVTSINEGKPFVLYNTQTVIAKQINKLALEMLGRETEVVEETSAKNGGFLKKLFK